MKKWEDIVKDKMEAFDETLPESVFAEFRALRNGTAPAPASKRFPLVWVLVPAVAATLAAILFLRQPALEPVAPENTIQVIGLPESPMADVPDSSGVAESLPAKPLIAQNLTPKANRHPSAYTQGPRIPEPVEEAEEAVVTPPIQETASPEPAAEEEKTFDKPVATSTSPFIPENSPRTKPVRLKVVPAAAGVAAGGGLLAAIFTPLARENSTNGTNPGSVGGGTVINGGGGPDYTGGGTINGAGGGGLTNSTEDDKPTGNPTHYFPFKGGLSVGIPISERWKVTTGLEYSLYRSNFTYTLSREKKQLAHYLGIPLRLDWTLANNRWLDVYLGGGIEADYCIAAMLAGKNIKRDAFSFSLMGAGGIQFNITKRIGLYVEPELSWTVPSKSRVLETYRSEHPLMFSVATGLRINLGK